MENSFTDEGIVLKATRYQEADKIITILSHYHGLIVLRAPGARRLTSKKTGHLDSLNLVKFHVTRSHHPQILTQAETIKNFSAIKNDLSLTQKAFFCAEVINQLAPQEQADGSLFQSFNNLLGALTGNQDKDKLLLTFLIFLLKHFGYPIPQTQDLLTLITHIEEITSHQLKSPSI